MADETTPPEEQEALEPKDCPRGHGPMRVRTRWANAQAHLGKKDAHAAPVTEWFCPRCGRTAPVD